MPEKVIDKKVYSLIEVTRSIQKTISERYTTAFWVKAEMNKLNLHPHSGHCYPELVEKKEGKVIAELKSLLWRDDYKRINALFLDVLKEPLKNGIYILFSARITFDPVFGLSLRILDIDPSYSLGELEREKQETVERLKQEGIYHVNRSLKFALLPKRIAIISVETSKGYADFMKIIQGNGRGYAFFHMLFPAFLQGAQSVPSIIRQLKRIRKVQGHFDVVAIVRGGGGDVGLTSYNHYDLAREIALFPLPVITGIGHSTNETVSEMIAYKNAITPTELAAFLVEHFHHFADPLTNSQEILSDRAGRLLKEENVQLLGTVKYFRSVTENMLLRNSHDLGQKLQAVTHGSLSQVNREKEEQCMMISVLQRELPQVITQTHNRIRQLVLDLQKDVMYSLQRGKLNIERLSCDLEKDSGQFMRSLADDLRLEVFKLSRLPAELLKNEKCSLEAMEKNITLMSPENVLKRGYSITLVNGRVLKNTDQVKKGDQLTTMVADGNITSTANTIHKPEEI